MAKQTITTTAAEENGKAYRANKFNASMRETNPEHVDLTPDEVFEIRCRQILTADVDEMRSERDARRAARVAAVNATKQAQIDAILDAP